MALGSERIEIVDEDLIVEGRGSRASRDGVLLGQVLADTTRDVDSGQRFEFSVRYSAPVRAPGAVAGYQLTTEGDVEG